MNWKYDYYNCPDDPDTGVPACGDLPECKSCECITSLLPRRNAQLHKQKAESHP